MIEQELPATPSAALVAKDRLCYSHLVAFLGDSALVHITGQTTSYGAWQHLKSLYAPGGFMGALLLMQQLINASVDGSEGVKPYINTLRRIQADLTVQQMGLPNA